MKKYKKYDYDDVEMEVDGVRVPIEESDCVYYPATVRSAGNDAVALVIGFSMGFSLAWLFALVVL
jgi:hypothetical protein